MQLSRYNGSISLVPKQVTESLMIKVGGFSFMKEYIMLVLIMKIEGSM